MDSRMDDTIDRQYLKDTMHNHIANYLLSRARRGDPLESAVDEECIRAVLAVARDVGMEEEVRRSVAWPEDLQV